MLSDDSPEMCYSTSCKLVMEITVDTNSYIQVYRDIGMAPEMIFHPCWSGWGIGDGFGYANLHLEMSSDFIHEP
jgi:hypothetical protein